ncbi:Fur family transcriptional regulator [Alicyclobacillus acidocaldarius]|uniref:Ferric uptake regulator, Fur family n=1 Tax=Alicyclobacillus acidocaldarius subsp. acidocaldarius (strain ATCC 27009 / DSM 446 / BCRC 14685 / JCM 5260 / KCTC 1825 / NBRC 15652 / NCIMB 11725 / NRRL B-14509 / 104-IA) TaxID=521098 RepID=C8WT10_ALIAD|nr:Fur family transcriptional regulator [Alicyclobacillus acidocaldarius]ACV59525.1 ferric uptake regulator, Fur family [Alicyclobacillus acidocaldarius subsp. acidocaldarius DSM 446]
MQAQKDAVQLLKNAGLRVTPQREAILQFLLDYDGHATVDDIYTSLQDRFPSMSVSTVYNTVKQLSQVGLVKEIGVGEGASRFDINVEPHHHLVCTRCGALFDFYLEEPIQLSVPPEARGFEVEDYHVEVRGICPKCKQQQVS